MVDELSIAAGSSARIVASGRITQSLPHLLQLIADAAGTPVQHVALKRATLRGTALVAMETVAPDVERANPPVVRTYEPQLDRSSYYVTPGNASTRCTRWP